MPPRTIKEVLDSGRPYMVDVEKAQDVRIEMDQTGKLWVNVDGVCVLRVGQMLLGKFIVETPKVVKEFTCR